MPNTNRSSSWSSPQHPRVVADVPMNSKVFQVTRHNVGLVHSVPGQTSKSPTMMAWSLFDPSTLLPPASAAREVAFVLSPNTYLAQAPLATRPKTTKSKRELLPCTPPTISLDAWRPGTGLESENTVLPTNSSDGLTHVEPNWQHVHDNTTTTRLTSTHKHFADTGQLLKVVSTEETTSRPTSLFQTLLSGTVTG